MEALTQLSPVDYLVIGHITCDLTAEGPKMGGTAAYSGLTALATGLRVGIVTSWGEELPLGSLAGATTINLPTEHSTTFENIYAPAGRTQIVHHTANEITPAAIPAQWRNTPIVHLGPLVAEVNIELIDQFPKSLIGVTPQGWLRSWDQGGKVFRKDWNTAAEILPQVTITVISSEDVDHDEEQIENLAAQSEVFVVTDGYRGARVYWHGDVRRFRAPQVDEINATGAGDIFATAFFIQFYKTRDAWAAARFANQVAALSVTRAGLDSVPTSEEIKSARIEVF